MLNYFIIEPHAGFVFRSYFSVEIMADIMANKCICIVFRGRSKRDMISFDVRRIHRELWRSKKKDSEGSMIYGTALGVVISHSNSNVRNGLKTVSHEK